MGKTNIEIVFSELYFVAISQTVERFANRTWGTDYQIYKIEFMTYDSFSVRMKGKKFNGTISFAAQIKNDKIYFGATDDFEMIRIYS